MATTLTEIQVINQALRNLGEDPVDATTLTELATDPTRRAQLALEFYPIVRDATLAAHPWTFALQRRRLLAYVEPAGTLTPGTGALTAGTTGVIFTASTLATFVAADVGKVLQGDGVAGKATITGFTSGTIVTATIVTAFSTLTAIATGSWRLYYAPAPWVESWDNLAFTILKPADCLAVWRSKGNQVDATPVPLYAVETNGTQEVILSDTDQFDCWLIMQVTDPLRWNAMFVQALQRHLSAVFAENITGKLPLFDRFWQLYQASLRQARSRQALESPRRFKRSSPLVDVRLQGSTGTQGIWNN
jgi:hypothetical protein